MLIPVNIMCMLDGNYKILLSEEAKKLAKRI
jgi:hypothetical protein